MAAVARRGHIGYLEAVGVQEIAARTPMTARSLFRIYSMTRPVTAVAVMMLHEEGRFDLDDPVARFIPEFGKVAVLGAPGAPTRAPARPITVRDLLLHTSGLQPRTSEIYRREQVRSRSITMAQFIANLVRVPLMEDPGTRYRYSEGTSVLGRLVEIWSGRPFEVFLEERIFKPLRMPDTMFWAGTPEQRARLTTVYNPTPEGGLTPVETETLPFTERPALIEGAVGLLSTVPDYLRFSQMLLNKGELDGVRLLRAATVETMTKNGLSEAVQQTKGGAMGWGLANVEVVEYGRIRLGRHGRHDLLGRSGHGAVDRPDDREPAVESRSDTRAIQGHRAAGHNHAMSSRTLLAAMCAGILVAGGVARMPSAQQPAAAGAPAQNVPTFRADSTWPSLPSNWVLGEVSSIAVDSRDHIWVLHRPRSIPAQQRASAAPPVLEFDAAGTLLGSWGGPNEAFDWPEREHGIFVDSRGFVWISGNGGWPKPTGPGSGDDMILKFTAAGTFVMQIGHRGQSKGNTDTVNVRQPADVFVHAPTNELFVADGYGNQRVAVFDAGSGKFKRAWGAYGKTPPTEVAGNPPTPAQDQVAAETKEQFGLVHAVKVSSDGVVYVADRTHNRIQTFTTQGKFIRQVRITPDGATTPVPAGFRVLARQAAALPVRGGLGADAHRHLRPRHADAGGVGGQPRAAPGRVRHRAPHGHRLEGQPLRRRDRDQPPRPAAAAANRALNAAAAWQEPQRASGAPAASGPNPAWITANIRGTRIGSLVPIGGTPEPMTARCTSRVAARQRGVV